MKNLINYLEDIEDLEYFGESYINSKIKTNVKDFINNKSKKNKRNNHKKDFE